MLVYKEHHLIYTVFQLQEMKKIIIEPSMVSSLFKCSLCNGVINLATVINECFHRFCKVCITNYFANNHATCPQCQITITNPLQTLRFDHTFQRLLYKIFPNLFQHDVVRKSSLLTAHGIADIQNETKITVRLQHWDVSLNIFSNQSRTTLSPCYLECQANTPLLVIEKFLRIKYSLPLNMKIDLFHKSLLLNTNEERLVDICYCFNIVNKSLLSVDIQFTVRRYGYRKILRYIRQPKQFITIDSSNSTTDSTELTHKMKQYQSQGSTTDRYTTELKPSSVELADIINGSDNRKKSSKNKLNSVRPRRRIRFLPTMVEVPPSIFDCISNQQYDFNSYQINQRTICKVTPYIPETTESFDDNNPLDLSLKSIDLSDTVID